MGQAIPTVEIQTVLNKLLRPELFCDYAPNGLQIEASPAVSKIITGVTACDSLIDAAIERQANALLVHHGYFWKGESLCLTGFKGRRIKKLFEHGISLFGYHLPLDAHFELGNNYQLGLKLGIENMKVIKQGEVRCLEANNMQLTFTGEAHFPSLADLGNHIEKILKRKPLLIQGNVQRPIETIAWCTGGAQNEFANAIQAGADVFITGEVSEKNYHEARETGVHFIAAGHHATERYGVQALGDWLTTYFGIETLYVDINNPV